MVVGSIVSWLVGIVLFDINDRRGSDRAFVSNAKVVAQQRPIKEPHLARAAFRSALSVIPTAKLAVGEFARSEPVTTSKQAKTGSASSRSISSKYESREGD